MAKGFAPPTIELPPGSCFSWDPPSVYWMPYSGADLLGVFSLLAVVGVVVWAGGKLAERRGGPRIGGAVLAIVAVFLGSMFAWSGLHPTVNDAGPLVCYGPNAYKAVSLAMAASSAVVAVLGLLTVVAAIVSPPRAAPAPWRGFLTVAAAYAVLFMAGAELAAGFAGGPWLLSTSALWWVFVIEAVLAAALTGLLRRAAGSRRPARQLAEEAGGEA